MPPLARLGAIANIHPLGAAHEPPPTELTIAPLRSGARPAAGGDWPVSSADALQNVHVAVNRVAPDGGDTPCPRSANPSDSPRR